MGARVQVLEAAPRARTRGAAVGFLSLDVLWDKRGEFFQIRVDPAAVAEVCVMDVQPKNRHLLLLGRGIQDGKMEKSKFLCGHDERHWFVAAIPESAAVSNVRDAKTALKPSDARVREESVRLRGHLRHRRRNAAWIRQGEWFFLPAPDFAPKNDLFILRNEPLSRGGGKAHMAEEAYRTGGETVYVSPKHPQGVSADEYSRLRGQGDKGPWQQMVRNARVYVRGRIRHPDHATIHLDGWHRVLMNRENEARAMSWVTFLD
jgi:hypothetical protein